MGFLMGKQGWMRGTEGMSCTIDRGGEAQSLWDPQVQNRVLLGAVEASPTECADTGLCRRKGQWDGTEEAPPCLCLSLQLLTP